MDSVTQAVFGATVAGVCAPAGYRGRGLLAGAALGTLPDLDVFLDYGGVVENFTYHRGFSHSLFVLAPVSLLIWLAVLGLWQPARAAPGRWLAVIGLALVTHPLLDAHTAYGTQLFWPIPVSPTSWSTLFIIDPLYTLPLIVGVIVAALRRHTRAAPAVLAICLSISTVYMGWSWVARGLVAHEAKAAMLRAGLVDAPIFLTPTPFNTLLWRVVILTGDGHLEGLDSVVIDEGPMQLSFFPSDTRSLEAASDIWAVDRLRWFTRDFLEVSVRDGRLVLADIRMGQAPVYLFSFVVAELDNPHWREIPGEAAPRSDFSLEDFGGIWTRIWTTEQR
jgi:inner membrane protein